MDCEEQKLDITINKRHSCKLCKYTTDRLSNYNKHIKTKKHNEILQKLNLILKNQQDNDIKQDLILENQQQFEEKQHIIIEKLEQLENKEADKSSFNLNDEYRIYIKRK